MLRRLAAFSGVVLLLVAFAGPSARADDYSNRFGITTGGGGFKMVGGNVDQMNAGPMIHLGARLGWKNQFDVEVSGRTGLSWDLSDNFRTRVSSLDLGALYNMKPDGRWTPQVFGGVGVYFWHVADFRNEASRGAFDNGRTSIGFDANGTFQRLTNTNFAIHLGLGAEIAIGSRFALRAAVRLDHLIDQDKDTSGASDTLGLNGDPQAFRRAIGKLDANELVPAAFVGLTYFFGARDSDQDGLPNSIDPCPNEAEDVDGYQDDDGCVDPDNDGDGIPDVEDVCPDEAEDLDGFEDTDGCPDPDNDGDGVLDVQDACPDQAEDVDGFQDTDGCPDYDDDGDAVPDSLDQCSETPAGVPVDQNGCPAVMSLDQERVLGAVGFEKGTANLLPQSYAVLDSLELALRAFPKVHLEIQGHTDGGGSKQEQERTSQQKAESVRSYLVVRGVDAGRLIAAGYGFEQPLLPDPTASGNERIVVKPIEASVLEIDLEPIQIPEASPTPEPE